MLSDGPATFFPSAAIAPSAAVDFAFAFPLLTSPAVERAEHRSGPGGEEAHVSERSELCAAPPAREERREPMRRSRIGSRPARVSLGYFSLHEQREVSRSCKAGVKASLSSFRLGGCILKSEAATGAKSRAFASLRDASYFSLLVQRKASQKKTRPASAPGALRASGPLRRRDFSTRHPCRVEKRRASMHAALRVVPTGSVAAEGSTESQKSNAATTATVTFPPLPVSPQHLMRATA